MRAEQPVRQFNHLLTDFAALVKLVARLLLDGRVSKFDKTVLGTILIYVLNPMDVMPDVVPIVGQIDDAYLVSLALLRLVNRTDESILREHWGGRRDVVQLIKEITELGTFYLPEKVRIFLVGRAEGKQAERGSIYQRTG